MKIYILLGFIILTNSCATIIERNRVYDDQLPYRFIHIMIQDEVEGEKKFLSVDTWEEHWQNRINQLKKSGYDNLIPFIIQERRKRGLPDLKGYGR